MALVFLESTWTPFLLTMKSKKTTLSTQNVHLSTFAKKLDVYQIGKNNSQVSYVLMQTWLYIKISLKYTTTNLPMQSLRTWFMSLMNVLGALVWPKCITNRSYNPNLTLKEIFHSLPSLFGDNHSLNQF